MASEDSQKTGLAASSALHALVLACLLVGFAVAPKFEDASETTPVDTITKDKFEQMMGERSAKPPPAPKIEKPAPPLPPQPPTEPRKVEETPAPSPPQPPTPPPKVETAKLPPPPAPPPRPEPPSKPEAMETAQPPVKPKIVDTPPPERPRATPPEKGTERPKPDQFAKLLAKTPPEEPPKDAPKSTAKPYDVTAIAKLIGDAKPSPASTSQINPGLPSARAARMSGSLQRQLDDWFKDAYMACWSPPPTIPDGDVYIPEVQVTFNADGTLSGTPVLVNPPPDPVWRAHAESAVRAARRCNPMKIPTQYAPFFEQWRTKTIHFDPREALG